jgi:hypothetical protein
MLAANDQIKYNSLYSFGKLRREFNSNNYELSHQSEGK